MKQFSIKPENRKTGKLENRNEKGVALILTLGILSFLLVLALGFASSAITQKKAAANSASVALSRILAESAAEKCLAGLAFYTDNAATAAFDVMYSHEEDDPNGNDETFDQLYRISTTQNGITYYEWDSSSYDKDDDDAIHWQYVYNGESSPDERIIGRYAYVVIPSGGKLNPGYCVSHTATYPDGTSRDESDETVGTVETRVGKNVNEIRIGKLFSSIPATYMTVGDLTNLSTDGGGGGKLVDGGTWADLDTIFAPANLNITDSNKKMYWNEWFAVNNTADKEQFWIDTDNDSLQDSGEFYHRFNIARTDWPNNDAGATNADNIAFMNNYILKDPSVWAAAPDSDGDGIPWLKYWGENSGSWTDATTKSKQIAANLIDYCDEDSDATRDNDDAPTFVGLEKCPYLNEIMLKFNGSVAESDKGDGTSDYTYSITPTAYVEVCDMNADNLAAWGGNTNPTSYANLQAIVNVEISFDWQPGGSDTATFSVTVNLNGASPAPAGGYAIDSQIAAVINNAVAHNAANGQPRSITNLKITSLKVKMLSGGGSKYYDFAYIDDGSNGTYDLTTDGSSADRYISYGADDPRQNLHYSDWSAPSDGTTATWTEKAKNSACNPNPGGDKDTETGASEPWEVSTAYIRNAPMQSPWELGFIHRAAKWETINLKKYNSDDDNNGTVDAGEFGVKASFGGMAYAKGDANILDQIKMHPENSVYGKFNIRAPQNVDVLRALLGGIYIGTNDLSTWTGGSELTYTSATAGEVPTLANAIYGSSERPFLTRAQVAKVTSLFDASLVSAQTTDAKKEEIIGKFINLTKTDVADEFMIIVMAQSIKDIGDGVTIYKDLNYDGDVTDTNLDGTSGDPGYFWDGSAATSSDRPNLNETIANCQYGVYDLGADEILAEQKILVRVKYDSAATNGSKWIITRYEYLED